MASFVSDAKCWAPIGARRPVTSRAARASPPRATSVEISSTRLLSFCRLSCDLAIVQTCGWQHEGHISRLLRAIRPRPHPGSQVNFLSQALLTELLAPALARSAPSRVVNVVSEAHRFVCLYLSLFVYLVVSLLLCLHICSTGDSQPGTLLKTVHRGGTPPAQRC